jgi:hypothetical protein
MYFRAAHDNSSATYAILGTALALHRTAPLEEGELTAACWSGAG